MSWREAFLKQARSENQIRLLLDDPAIEYSHRLHYLQMVTEKLSKGMMANALDPEPPTPTHLAFVRLLQVLKGRPDIRAQLGYSDSAVFRKFINSLLGMAMQIERLSPAAAGPNHPNPEYPWRDQVTGRVLAPADFEFSLFDPTNPKMIKLEKLLNALLQVVR